MKNPIRSWSAGLLGALLLFASPGPRRISRPHRQDRGAVRCRRQHRHRGPRAGAAPQRQMERAGDRRKPSGRGQHHRRQRRRQGRARRLHAAVRQHQHLDQSEPVQDAALRHAEGPRAGHVSLAVAERAAGAAHARRQHAEGAAGAGQVAASQAAELCLGRQGQRAPLLHGAAQERGRRCRCCTCPIAASRRRCWR